MTIREKCDALRRLMSERGLTAYLVPNTDPHQGEYVPDCWQRRRWMSGFTGSVGDFVITLKEAGLWVDGRYHIQAARELKGSGITLYKMGNPGVPTRNAWLARTLEPGVVVGADPQVFSLAAAKDLEAALAPIRARVVWGTENLVDLLWGDRPALPADPIRLLPPKYTGESAVAKLRRLRKTMKERRADAIVISALDAVAWLYNLRGSDVLYNPVAIAYAVVTSTEASLFIRPEKVPASLGAKLAPAVQLRPYEAMEEMLRGLAERKARVWLDGSAMSRWAADLLGGCDLLNERSPVALMKAKKNAVEIAGMRAAHMRDGVAMVRFLRWLESEVPRGGVTEISATAQIDALRAEVDLFQGLSFDTISGYADHGAIVHYRVTPKTDVPLRPVGIFLLDSGGQYLDGTTDITRTVLLGGKATKEQKERFTRVLRGHIALARTRFPAGTRGVQLDTVARLPLWEAGLNYDHGTGHGVGAYLSVHEGPQSIVPARDSGAALEPGNILSNEPGYYEAGAYGLRVENLVLVAPDPELSRDGKEFLRFETISFCPIDTRLVEPRLLTEMERRWLNDYHQRVFRTLSPRLEPAERQWLRRACAPV